MKILKLLGKFIVLVFIFLVGALSGKFPGFFNASGLAFIFLGGAALSLMSFTLPEIRLAFKHIAGGQISEEEVRKSIYFWEASARNFILLGVLGTMTNFIKLIGNVPSIKSFFSSLAVCFLTTVYGVIMAVLSSVPAIILLNRQKTDRQSERVENDMRMDIDKNEKQVDLRFENIFGFGLFLAIVAWIMQSPGTLKLFGHWPSYLVVVGGTVGLVILIGNVMGGRSITLGFAFSGFIGSMIGLVQILHFLTGGTIHDVVSAICFSLLSCFTALLGIILVGIPIEDRAFKHARIRQGFYLSRFVWYGFPLVSLIFIAFAVVMVITPVNH